MADLSEQLKQKYQPALDAINREGAELRNVHLEGAQLVIRATAVSQASKNRIWDAIKAADPRYAVLKADIEIRKGDQTYTVKAGDNLSKISNCFYGDPKQYSKIAQANQLADPDKIQVGQQLLIPAA